MKADFEKGTKVCSKCRKELPLDSFRKNKSQSDGFNCYCIECNFIYNNNYFKNNSQKILNRSINWRNSNLERCRKIEEKYRANHKEDCTQRILAWKQYQYKTNAEYRLVENLRGRFLKAIRNNQKSGHTLELLDCTIEELKQHLESQFEPGMTWDNYGKDGWEIDHIIPCAYFDLTKEENQRICFNYRNLQPLWARDNYKKSDEVPDNVEELVEFLKQEIYG
jgi:hypothetical protein